VIGKIFHREVTAVIVAEVDNLPSDVAFVKRVSTTIRDCSVAVGEGRVSEDFSFGWCFTVCQVRLCRVRPFCRRPVVKTILAALPVASDDLRDWKAGLGIVEPSTQPGTDQGRTP
jgi:hypothetical protein